MNLNVERWCSMKEICEYLGVTPSEFFDDNINCPANYREIIEDMNALDSDQLQNIKAIIKGLKKR